VSGTILAKSKFYGNSTSAILDGVATLSLLARGEVSQVRVNKIQVWVTREHPS